MRVLLDEDVPIRLRLYFSDEITVETVEYRGWKGLKNGALLCVAQEHFDVLVTLDNSIPYQQPSQRLDLAIVVLRPSLPNLEDMVELVPEVQRVLKGIQSGHVVRVFPAE